MAVAVLVTSCGGGGSSTDGNTSSSTVLRGTDDAVDEITTVDTVGPEDVVIADLDSDREDGRFSLLITTVSNTEQVIANLVKNDSGEIIRIEGILYVHQASGGLMAIEYGEDHLPVRIFDSLSNEVWTYVEQTDEPNEFLFSVESGDGSIREEVVALDPDVVGFFRVLESDAAFTSSTTKAAVTRLDKNTEENLRQAATILGYGIGVTAGAVTCGLAATGTAGAALFACGGAVAAAFGGFCQFGEVDNGLCGAFDFVNAVNKCSLPVNCTVGVVELVLRREVSGAADCAFQTASEVLGAIGTTSTSRGAFLFSTSAPEPSCSTSSASNATSSAFDGGFSFTALGW